MIFLKGPIDQNQAMPFEGPQVKLIYPDERRSTPNLDCDSHGPGTSNLLPCELTKSSPRPRGSDKTQELSMQAAYNTLGIHPLSGVLISSFGRFDHHLANTQEPAPWQGDCVFLKKCRTLPFGSNETNGIQWLDVFVFKRFIHQRHLLSRQSVCPQPISPPGLHICLFLNITRSSTFGTSSLSPFFWGVLLLSFF